MRGRALEKPMDDLDLSSLNDLNDLDELDDYEIGGKKFLEEFFEKSVKKEEETEPEQIIPIQELINNESIETIEIIETPIVTTDVVDTVWTRPLSTVNNQTLKLKDFNQEYIFRRVIDPGGNQTNRFEVFFRNVGGSEDSWQTLNGLLTDKYVVASSSDFVEHIKRQIDLTEPVISSEPWRSIWYGKTRTNIEYFDDETSRMIFSLITGIDDTIVSNLVSTISLTVSNSYDGKRTLRVDYNINSTGIINDNNIELRDFFSLGRFSHKVIHNSSIVAITADIRNIQENIVSTIDSIKNYEIENINNLIETISKGFKKDNGKKFNSLCDNLIPEYKNLYHILICASATLGSGYSIIEHTSIRSIIDRIFESIF